MGAGSIASVSALIVPIFLLDVMLTIVPVVSGGGGWGPKQGLLSLDPELKFGEVTDARYDFQDIESPEEEQRQALGDVASSGDFIQFFMPGEATITEPTLPLRKDFDRRRMSNTIGCIPSSIDDVPIARRDETFYPFHLVKGHFGALSEHGLYLETDGVTIKSDPNVTKIDLPYSRFVQSSPKVRPPQRPKRTLGQKLRQLKYENAKEVQKKRVEGIEQHSPLKRLGKAMESFVE